MKTNLLFSGLQKREKERIKVPVYNLAARKIELFYPLLLFEGFSVLKCVTFSSSIKHLVEVILNLKIRKVEIIIGLAEDYSLITSAFNLKEGIIDILLKKVKVSLYEARGVHSKIYLLENKERKRVIVGSANLSHIAWSGKQKEIFLYSDDLSDYEAFKKIYEEIKEKAICVVNNDDIKKERENLEKNLSVKFQIESIENLSLGSATENVLSEILESAERIENLAISNVTITGIINRNVVEKEKVRIENQKSVLEKANTLLENKKEVLWRKERAVEALLRDRKSDIEAPKPPKLGITYRDGKFYLNGILPVEEPDRDKVKENLQALVQIFEVIGKYNADIVQFIMEAIMFSFAGGYFWKLREFKEVDKVRVPIFGLLAGVSQGGKSLTLQIIEKLTGGTRYEFDKIKIEGTRTPAEIVDIYLFDEKFGVNPLLIDEIPLPHLTKYALYNKIKSLTNTVEGFVHGVIIGAFNIEKGLVPKEILRRVFYVPFRRELPRQLDLKLSEAIKKLDDSLFRLFFASFSLDSLFDLITEEDLLRPIRIFFKELLKNFGVSLPISEKYLGSYEEFMLNEWKILYGTSPEYFIETEWKDSSGRVRKAFKIEASKLKHIVPLHYFSLGTAGEYKIIDKEKFFESIGEREKRLFKFFSFFKRF